MLRHTSIHTYNIPEETNPLSEYVLCVRSEHGWTRLLNTPGGAQQECQQPLFSTLQHAAHKHSCPSHAPFVLQRSGGVPVMDTVSLPWTFIAGFSSTAAFGHEPRTIRDRSARRRRDQEHAFACQERIIENERNRNSDT